MNNKRERISEFTHADSRLNARLQAAKEALCDASWRLEAERQLGPINQPELFDTAEHIVKLEQDLEWLLRLKRLKG